MWFNFFDRTLCLNQPERTDRKQQAIEEFSRIGLHTVEFFSSIPHPEPLKSFCLSQHAIIKNLQAGPGDRWLVLEDDCVFRDCSKLMHSLTELPPDWDIVYLGANIYGDGFHGHLHRYSKHLVKINLAWTSHAIGYSRRMVDWIIENYTGAAEGHMYDNWLSNRLHLRNSFVTRPMVAWQRPVYSELWGRDVDYTGCFDKGNELLKCL